MSQELFDFAFIPNYEVAISYLAENLAEQEPWDFNNPSTKKFPILKNYLEHTYRKLKVERKITFTSDNKFATFNTGLTTDSQEDIFAFFEESHNTNPRFTTPFCFKAFLKKSDNQILTHFASNLPDVANYFNNPELLIFNPRHDLIPDIDHIIGDNISRFPSPIQSLDSSEIRRRLVGSIEEVKKRVRTNYKLAVPQYYNKHTQLLLPLNLTSGSPNPDLALVVYKLNTTTYTARTCLTIDMAYNNARLIVKPQSEWLKP